ncbi:MAG: hypothetical protein WAN86_19145 [Hyphomicrobiaceae bacterium]
MGGDQVGDEVDVRLAIAIVMLRQKRQRRGQLLAEIAPQAFGRARDSGFDRQGAQARHTGAASIWRRESGEVVKLTSP